MMIILKIYIIDNCYRHAKKLLPCSSQLLVLQEWNPHIGTYWYDKMLWLNFKFTSNLINRCKNLFWETCYILSYIYTHREFRWIRPDKICRKILRSQERLINFRVSSHSADPKVKFCFSYSLGHCEGQCFFTESKNRLLTQTLKRPTFNLTKFKINFASPLVLLELDMFHLAQLPIFWTIIPSKLLVSKELHSIFSVTI